MMKVLKVIGLVFLCAMFPHLVLLYLGICALLDVRKWMGDRIDDYFRRKSCDGEVIEAEVIDYR